MQITAYIVIVLVWLPPLISAIYNLAWDLRLWQNKDYHTGRVYHNLRWDFEPSHRRPLITAIKIVLFLAVGIFAFDPANSITPLAMLLAFALWVNEAYTIFERLIRGSFPRLKFNQRNLWILFTAVVGYAILITFLSISVLTANPANTYAFGELLPSTNALGTIFIPAVYIYLVFSTLLGFVLDLSSPLITFLLVWLTSPLAWLHAQIRVGQAKRKLAQLNNLVVIGITGSKGKSTVKNLLSDILSTHYPVVTTAAGQTNLLSLANTVLQEVSSQTKVLIVEMNAFKPNDILRLTQLVKPHISIVTSIDENHIGLFGSMPKLLEAKSELIENMRTGGTVILNSDDELSMDLAKRNDGKEIFYGLKTASHERLKNNLLEIDHYYADNIEHHAKTKTLTLVLHNQAHEFEIMLPAAANKIIHSVLAAIAASVEVGIPIPDIITNLQLSDLDYYTTLETFQGDNSTQILVDNQPVSINKLKQDLQQLESTDAPRKLLVVSGINELGQYKHETYASLIKLIRKSVDILFTYDPKLVKVAKRDNLNLQIVAAKNYSDLDYKLRELMQPKDAILIMGEFEPGFIYALSDE